MKNILRPPTTNHFGPFLLGNLLGESICHEVYEATREDAATSVDSFALKRIARHAFTDQVIKDFEFEQEVTENTNHPHLIKAIETGFIKEKPYLLLPKLIENVLTQHNAGLVFPQIAAALDSLHEQGFLHCDVSSKNILSKSAQQFILFDFSASTRVGSKQHRVKGTHSCMSPEQIKGETLHKQSDLFSLAVVAWETLTNNKLFTREAPHLTVMAVVEEQIPPTTLGTNVDAVFEKALHKVPSQRHDSCEEFIHELFKLMPVS